MSGHSGHGRGRRSHHSSGPWQSDRSVPGQFAAEPNVAVLELASLNQQLGNGLKLSLERDLHSLPSVHKNSQVLISVMSLKVRFTLECSFDNRPLQSSFVFA